jgi:hypothetical protein
MSLHHPDHEPYRHFTTRARVDKAVQTLQGFVRGITIDNELNAEEVAELMNWGRDYADLLGKAPFSELKEKLDEILADGRIDPEEQEDLLWVCRNLSPESECLDEITHDIKQSSRRWQSACGGTIRKKSRNLLLTRWYQLVTSLRDPVQ